MSLITPKKKEKKIDKQCQIKKVKIYKVKGTETIIN